MKNFKVGDIVKVINAGAAYSCSNLFAKKLKLTNFICGCIYTDNLETFIKEYKSDIFVVVSIYTFDYGTKLYGIQYPNSYPSKRQHVIHESGLELSTATAGQQLELF